MARAFLVSIAVVASFAAGEPASAGACTVSWDDGAGDRAWSSAANWDTDALPGSGDDVCIPALTGAPVVADLDTTVASVEAGHPVEIRRTFTGTLSAGTFTLDDGATLAEATIDGAAVAVAAGETATMTGGELAAGEVGGEGDVVIAAPAGARPQAGAGTAWSGGRMHGGGATTVAAGASLTIDAGPPPPGQELPISVELAGRRQLSNRGTVVWESGSVGVDEHSTVDNAGLLDLRSATGRWLALRRVSFDAPVANTGVILKSLGTNTVDFPGVDNDGSIRVIRGTVRFETLLQTIDGRIEIELGGGAAATEHGVVSVLDVARLSGTLALTRSVGYTPAAGDVFAVIDAGARRGEFTALEGADLGGDLRLVATYAADGVDLTATRTTATPATTATGATAPAMTPTATPAETSRGGDALTAAPLGRLVAVDDRFRRRAARVVRIRGLLANDLFPAGTRVELVGAPRGASVRLDERTGWMRIRLRSRRPRVVRLRYRLIAPASRPSRAAEVRIRLVGDP